MVDTFKHHVADEVKKRVREIIQVDGIRLHHVNGIENLSTMFRIQTNSGPRYFEVRIKESY